MRTSQTIVPEPRWDLHLRVGLRCMYGVRSERGKAWRESLCDQGRGKHIPPYTLKVNSTHAPSILSTHLALCTVSSVPWHHAAAQPEVPVPVPGQPSPVPRPAPSSPPPVRRQRLRPHQQHPEGKKG